MRSVLIIVVLIGGILLGGAIAPEAPPAASVPAITHSNDPCQEDETLWWTGTHIRGCVNVEELCQQ